MGRLLNYGMRNAESEIIDEVTRRRGEHRQRRREKRIRR